MLGILGAGYFATPGIFAQFNAKPAARVPLKSPGGWARTSR